MRAGPANMRRQEPLGSIGRAARSLESWACVSVPRTMGVAFRDGPLAAVVDGRCQWGLSGQALSAPCESVRLAGERVLGLRSLLLGCRRLAVSAESRKCCPMAHCRRTLWPWCSTLHERLSLLQGSTRPAASIEHRGPWVEGGHIVSAEQLLSPEPNPAGHVSAARPVSTHLPKRSKGCRPDRLRRR